MARISERNRAHRAGCRWWEGTPPSNPSALLTWAPPAQTSPTTVNFNNTLSASGTTYTWTGSDNTDYNLVCQEVLNFSVICDIGQNSDVRAFGWEQSIPAADADGAAGFVVELNNTGSSFHAEGWRSYGAGLRDMMDVEAGAADSVLQIQNFYMDVHGIPDDAIELAHPDVIQSWNGPGHLRIDRLSANLKYQGLYFEPDDTSGGMTIDEKTWPIETDIRNVDLRIHEDQPDDVAWMGPLLWHHPWTNVTIANPAHAQYPDWQAYVAGCYHENLWIEPWSSRGWSVLTTPHISAWGHDSQGRPAVWVGRRSTRFVDPDAVGIGYVSPGYLP